MNEFSIKQDKVKTLLAKHNLEVIVLERVSSFAWATCGASSYINTADAKGVAALVITDDGSNLVTNNIEAPRFEKEEKLVAQGWEFQVEPWYKPNHFLESILKNRTYGSDNHVPGGIDLSADMAQLRSDLLPEERERFFYLGRLCSDAMDVTMRAIHQGQSEHEIAAKLSFECEKRGVQAIANLIATDDRVSTYRHPVVAENGHPF